MKLRILNIQRFSLHDGPGIRTTVFFRGCDMRCRWCANPESTGPVAGSGSESESAGPGAWIGVEDLVTELRRDITYFEDSGGGITLSGGEATMQFPALVELLGALRAEGLGTVLQTNGLLARERLAALAGLVDLFHFDLKGIDEPRHRVNTGVDNGLILENAAWLSASGHPVVFRVPLIPGFNDGPEDLVALGHFLDSIDARAVEVLPYHPLGEGKIDRYGLDFPRLGLPAMPEAVAMEKAERLRGRGRDLSVAGREI